MATIPADYATTVANVQKKVSEGTLVRSNQELQRLQRASNVAGIAEFLASIANDIKAG